MKHVFATCSLSLVAMMAAAAADAADTHPCERETAALMDVHSSWAQIYSATHKMPEKCFDGYFAEGISDTLVRKAGQDWPGFISLLRQHPDDNRFLSLVIKSINETVDPDDVLRVKLLAEHSCQKQASGKCSAILRVVDSGFGEYFRNHPHGS
jgi:hypothetical protein